MALKPEDIKKPGAPTPRSGGARVSPQDMRNRLTKIKDPGTAQAMGKVAAAMGNNAEQLRRNADNTKRRHDELAGQLTDSGRRIADAKGKTIAARKAARMQEIDADTAAGTRKAQGEFNDVKEKEYPGEPQPVKYDPMTMYLGVAESVFTVAAGLQKSREDMEKKVDLKRYQLETARATAQNKPRIIAGMDGTQESFIKAENELAAIYASQKERFQSVHKDDPDFDASLEAHNINIRTQLLPVLGTENHNQAVEETLRQTEEVVTQAAALAAETGSFEYGFAEIEDLREVLEAGYVKKDKIDTYIRASKTTVLGATIDHYKSTGQFDKIDEIFEQVRPQFTGQDHPVASSAFDHMNANGLDVDQTFAILFSETENLDPNIQNPMPGQTASGFAQQISKTFRGGFKQVYGYDPGEGALAKNFPVEVQAKVAMKVLADDQERVRRSLGVSTLSDSQAYFAHLYGATNAINIMGYKPFVRLDQIPTVSQDMINANKWRHSDGTAFTVGEVTAWANQRMRQGRQKARAQGILGSAGPLGKDILASQVASWSKEVETAKKTYVKEQIRIENELRDAHIADWDEPSDKGALGTVTIENNPTVGALYDDVQRAVLAPPNPETGEPQFTAAQIKEKTTKYARAALATQRFNHQKYVGGAEPSVLWYELLKKQDAARYASNFKNAENPEAAMRVIQGLRNQWGSHYPMVANQIAQEAKSPDFEVAMMIDPNTSPTFWSNASRVVGVKLEEFEKGLPPDVKLKGGAGTGSIEDRVRGYMEPFRDALQPTLSNPQIAGRTFESTVNVAMKMAADEMRRNPGMSAKTAAYNVAQQFEGTIKYISDNRTKITLAEDSIREFGSSIEEIGEGIDKLRSREVFDTLPITEFVAGVGDPSFSKPLRRPKDRVAEGTLEIGDYIGGVGRGGQVPEPTVQEADGDLFQVVVPGQSGHYGLFTDQRSAAEYAAAMYFRAREMVTFDREATMENFYNYGRIELNEEQNGVQFLVRTNGSSGFSPMYDMMGRPIVMPLEDVISLARQ